MFFLFLAFYIAVCEVNLPKNDFSVNYLLNFFEHFFSSQKLMYFIVYQ